MPNWQHHSTKQRSGFGLSELSGPGSSHRVSIERTNHGQLLRIHDMSIDHRGVDMRMAQQSLDLPHIASPLEQVCRKTMSKGVDGDALVQLGLKNQVQRVLRKWPVPRSSPRGAFSSPAFSLVGR